MNQGRLAVGFVLFDIVYLFYGSWKSFEGKSRRQTRIHYSQGRPQEGIAYPPPPPKVQSDREISRIILPKKKKKIVGVDKTILKGHSSTYKFPLITC